MKLHVFDMDGTLLRGAAVEEISRHLGCYEAASNIEQAWVRGELLDGVYFWEAVLKLWANATEEDLNLAFQKSSWMSGIKEMFEDITARGEYSVVISQSPLFIVKRLEAWGAQQSYATTVARGVPCHQDQMLEPWHKLEITMNLLHKFNLTAKDCVVYGDGSSDIDLFQTLPNSIAVNAQPFIKEMATKEYNGKDMWAAYNLGRSLFNNCLESSIEFSTKSIQQKLINNSL